MNDEIMRIVESYWSPYKELRQRREDALQAYAWFECAWEMKFAIHLRNEYLRKGFTKKQAWRLMMTHIN